MRKLIYRDEYVNWPIYVHKNHPVYIPELKNIIIRLIWEIEPYSRQVVINNHNEFIGRTTNKLQKTVELFYDNCVQLFQINVKCTLTEKIETFNKIVYSTSMKLQEEVICRYNFFRSRCKYH